MAKHDGERRIWINEKAHASLLKLSETTREPMRGLASIAIAEYCRTCPRQPNPTAKPKAKAGKDQ